VEQKEKGGGNGLGSRLKRLQFQRSSCVEVNNRYPSRVNKKLKGGVVWIGTS